MTRNNSGRSTTGERKIPEHYPTTADRNTAAHLRLTVSRYLSGRANRSEVDEAYRWFAATAAKAERPVCSNSECEDGTIFEGSCTECDQEIRKSCPTCAGRARARPGMSQGCQLDKHGKRYVYTIKTLADARTRDTIFVPNTSAKEAVEIWRWLSDLRDDFPSYNDDSIKITSITEDAWCAPQVYREAYCPLETVCIVREVV